MFTMHYRPTIILKMGERQAMETLESEYHDRFTPILLVPPRVWDYDTSSHQKTTVNHLQKLPVEMFKSRGKRKAFIDTRHLDEPDTLVDGTHALQWLVDEAADLGQTLIPVVALDSTSETVISAANVARKRGQGAALRVQLKSNVSVGSKEFAQLLTDLELPPTDIDLILDLASDVVNELATKATLPDLMAINEFGNWRSLTVAGAAFPNDAPQGRGVHEVHRADWSTVRRINFSLRNLGLREVDFSDYVISGDAPGLDIDPKFLTISATFRYTNGGQWLFSRGELYKASGGRGLGGSAMVGTIDLLRQYAKYQAEPHSQIHDWFEGVVDGATSGGNPTVWRKWATYHHIRTVLDQLSNPIEI